MYDIVKYGLTVPDFINSGYDLLTTPEQAVEFAKKWDTQNFVPEGGSKFCIRGTPRRRRGLTAETIDRGRVRSRPTRSLIGGVLGRDWGHPRTVAPRWPRGEGTATLGGSPAPESR